MKAHLLILLIPLQACTVVNDPHKHQGGGTDAGTDAGAQTQDAGVRVEAGEFCQRLAELQCQAYFSCCSSHPPMNMTNVMNCQTSAEMKCSKAYGSIILDSRTGYDPYLAAAVLAEGRSYVASCSTDIVTWEWERTGFQRALAGTVAGGGTCTPRDTSLTNFDEAALFSCMGPTHSCVPTARMQWSCLDRVAQGGSCVIYWDCVDGLRCSGLPFVNAMCAPRLPNGQGCKQGPDCMSLVCLSGTCQPRTQDNVYCSPGSM